MHPEVTRRLREEHDRVCGADNDSTQAYFRDTPHRAAAEMPYTTAVLRETLRLYPVGFTMREDTKTGGSFAFKGASYPSRGFWIISASHTMHRDPAHFGPDPKAFRPERWLDPAHAPDRAAFRSFELGPRACMGRELAMDQLRVVLALTVRWFDFSVARIQPNKQPRVSWCDFDTKVGDWAFQEQAMEARPRFGMPWTVKRTDRPL
jgi:cytochrome P450